MKSLLVATAALNQTPREVLETVRRAFAGHKEKQLRIWVDRFFVLWCRNQWKRERYAPSFHLDDKNLDPKSWCRFPILSGCFRRELDEMRAGAHGDSGDAGAPGFEPGKRK